MATGWPMKTTYANGDVYSASDVNDITGTVNLASGAQWAAGKNKIINGDFSIWQRGTSFSSAGYCADRYITGTSSTSGFSVSQQTFALGTAPVAGYEGQFFADIAGTITNASTGYIQFEQRVEGVRTYAGQTATLSFWAKGTASGTINIVFAQNFGSGGSAEVLTTPVNFNITTSWQRFTTTLTFPSIAGKTLGVNNCLRLFIVKNMGTSYPTYGTANYTGALSLWGVQLEQGSTATAFQTATGTIQGELAACQRYYYRTNPVSSAYSRVASGRATSTTNLDIMVPLPVAMRTTPTSVDFASLMTTTANSISAVAITQPTTTTAVADCTSSGLTSGTFYQVMINNSTSGYLGFSAEL